MVLAGSVRASFAKPMVENKGERGGNLVDLVGIEPTTSSMPFP
jgi:hypothetical protein